MLVYGHLPTAAELKKYDNTRAIVRLIRSRCSERINLTIHDILLIPRYCAKLSALRELPAALRTVLELVPKNAHPMDVMRTGACVL